MNVGDWMYFPNMGAYTIAAASKFNGFKQPKVIYMCRRKLVDCVFTEKGDLDASVISAINKQMSLKEQIIRNTSAAYCCLLYTSPSPRDS